MIKRIATALWGNFESTDEVKKFGFLALIFGLIIGTYWTLRPMKDSIFNAIVGGDYLPKAKMLSLVIIVPLVILYSKLVDRYPRHKVFYLLIALYATAALLFWLGFMNDTLGLANTAKSPARVIGWAWYVFVESFGSLIVALFWAFTTDTTAPNSARRGFPIISLFGQIGNIVGPYFLNAGKLGFAHSGPIVGICAVLMLLMGVLFWILMRVIPKSQLVGYESADEAKQHETEPGFLEGLKLLLTRGYLLGIFMVVTIYEVIITVFDNHFKQTVFETFSLEKDVNTYLSQYAVMTGVVATLCVLGGISNIQRRLGITVSLISLPVLVLVAVAVLKLNPFALTIAFWIMVLSKAINYALNQPTLKQLYIPTTKDTKYKAQAWIEMFGSRGAKGASSVINTFRSTFKAQYGALAGIPWFLTISSLLSVGLVGVWVVAALYIAKTYSKAIKEDRVVC